MKIVQINAVYGVGSTGRTCQEFHDYTVRQGHECMTFYGNQKGYYGDEARFIGSSISHKFHAITGRFFGDWGIGSWNSTYRLIKQLGKFRPDVIHLRNLHGNYVNLSMLLGYLAKNNIPTIISLDDFMPMTGGCAHFTLNGCLGWQHNCNPCHYLVRGKSYIFNNNASTAFKRRYRLFNSIPRLGVLGVSQWTASLAKQSPVFANARFVDYVYNWIDLNMFKPQGQYSDYETKKQLGIGNRHMILGVSSSWDNHKGLDKIIEVAKTLGEDYRIVLVGKMAKNLSLPDNIISIPNTDSPECLARYYSAADVFVHMSKQETFGKVVAEALACGTPAVVYNTTALPELVDSRCGAIINPTAPLSDIADVIITLCANSSTSMTDACIHQAKELFGMAQNCEKQLDFYNKLISETAVD